MQKEAEKIVVTLCGSKNLGEKKTLLKRMSLLKILSWFLLHYYYIFCWYVLSVYACVYVCGNNNNNTEGIILLFMKLRCNNSKLIDP